MRMSVEIPCLVLVIVSTLLRKDAEAAQQFARQFQAVDGAEQERQVPVRKTGVPMAVSAAILMLPRFLSMVDGRSARKTKTWSGRPQQVPEAARGQELRCFTLASLPTGKVFHVLRAERVSERELTGAERPHAGRRRVLEGHSPWTKFENAQGRHGRFNRCRMGCHRCIFVCSPQSGSCRHALHVPISHRRIARLDDRHSGASIHRVSTCPIHPRSHYSRACPLPPRSETDFFPSLLAVLAQIAEVLG